MIYSFQSQSIVMYNCIMQNNSSIEGGLAYLADPTGHILRSCCYDITTGYVAGGGAASFDASDPKNITLSPLFEAGSVRLSSNSPCIDSGCNSYIDSIAPPVTTDLDGNPRKMDGATGTPGGTVDIGAYEFQGIKE